MAFKTMVKTLSSKRLLKQQETKVNSKIVLDGEREVERVLEVVASVYVSNEERMGDIVQFSGVVNITTLFLNSEKVVDSENISVEFVDKVAISGLENLAIIPEISSSFAQKEGEKTIGVSVAVRSKIYGGAKEEVGIVCGEDDGFHFRSKEVQVDNLAVSSTSNFNLFEEIATNEQDLKILYSSASSFINKVIPHDNYVSLEGYAEVCVLYSSGSNVQKLTKIIDFNQEVACLNLTSDMVCVADIFTRNVLASLATDEGKNIINLDVSFGTAIWGYSRESVVLLTDLFAEKEDVSIVYSALNATSIEPIKSLSDRQTIVVDLLDKKRIDEVLDISNLCYKIEQVSFDDGKININGNVFASVIFRNYDSEDISSMNLSAPFELDFAIGLSRDAIVDASLCARVNSFKNKAGKDISLVVDFDVNLIAEVSRLESFISAYDSSISSEIKDSSIIVYHPEESESVFDIAKALKMSPEVLLAQNPGLETGGTTQKIVVYKRAN